MAIYRYVQIVYRYISSIRICAQDVLSSGIVLSQIFAELKFCYFVNNGQGTKILTYGYLCTQHTYCKSCYPHELNCKNAKFVASAKYTYLENFTSTAATVTFIHTSKQ